MPLLPTFFFLKLVGIRVDRVSFNYIYLVITKKKLAWSEERLDVSWLLLCRHMTMRIY